MLRSDIIALFALGMSVLTLAALGYLILRIPSPPQSVVQTHAVDSLPQREDRSDLEVAITVLRNELSGVRRELQKMQNKDREVSPNPGISPNIQDPQEWLSQWLEAPLEDDHVAAQIIAYTEELGESDWGRGAARSIEEAAAANPILSRAGAAFVADCRETACRVAWSPPDLAELPEAEQADAMAFARYELIALVAQAASDVGPMAVEWVPGGDSSELTVHFQRGVVQ